MRRIVFLVLWCCCLGCLSGCGGTKFPADFPKVHPMTVTVKDGVTPLPEVRIMFYPVTTDTGSVTAAYASSGSTDANGVAKIRTAQGGFSKAGIPVGEFVVTVEDIIDLEMGISPEERAKMSMGELNKLSQEQRKLKSEYKKKVPEVLCKTGSVETRSPIRYTVTEGKNELPIDVAEYKK